MVPKKTNRFAVKYCDIRVGLLNVSATVSCSRLIYVSLDVRQINVT